MDNAMIRDYFESLQLYSNTEVYIALLCAQIVNALAVIWNILALVVLLQVEFRTSAINKYLACLCFVFFLDSICKLIFDTIEVIDVSILDAIPYLCPGRTLVEFVLQTLTVMLVTTVSVERYIAIVHPFSRMADVGSATVLKVGIIT